MSQVTKPIMLDSTGRALVEKINELKQVLSPTGELVVDKGGTYDVSEKGTVRVKMPQDMIRAITVPIFYPSFSMKLGVSEDGSF